MRKIIVQTEISFDAVQENPHLFAFDYEREDVDQSFKEQISRTDGLLMGRITYEGFAEVWPTMAGQNEMADKMNSLPKYVASRTLKEPLSWNASTLLKDVVAEVTTLKQQEGGDLLQYGVGELTQTLLQAGLIDEMRFLVYPVAVGSGARVFEKFDKTSLKLLTTKTFKAGIVAMHYQPVSNG